jgi:hypothetical protein
MPAGYTALDTIHKESWPKDVMFLEKRTPPTYISMADVTGLYPVANHIDINPVVI